MGIGTWGGVFHTGAMTPPSSALAVDSPLLDNIVWHALHGPHRAFREGTGGAARYQSDVAVFAALPDTPTAADWDDMAALVRTDGAATLLQPPIEEPESWTRVMVIPATQMVATEVDGALDPDVVDLGASDVGEMVALVEATKPGPFARRTVELGGYVGIRAVDGSLAAMAGHRMRVPGFVEVSAVCTDPRSRGQGLAERLVRHVVARAAAAGERVILHAAATNEGAIRLYERMGFEHRRDIEAVSLTPPAAPPSTRPPIC